MTRWFGSFLIRFWLLEGEEQRVEIQHIQSGEQVRVKSLEAALDWVKARASVNQPAETDPVPSFVHPTESDSFLKGEKSNGQD